MNRYFAFSELAFLGTCQVGVPLRMGDRKFIFILLFFETGLTL
jgi:hypothetical protein